MKNRKAEDPEDLRKEYLRRKLQAEDPEDLATSLLFEILSEYNGSEEAIKKLIDIVQKKPGFDDRRIVRTLLTGAQGTREGLKTLARTLSGELRKSRQEARHGYDIGIGTVQAIESLESVFSEALEKLTKEVKETSEQKPVPVKVDIPEIPPPKIVMPDLTPKSLKLPKKIEVTMPEMPGWYKAATMPDLPITKEGRLRVEVDRVGGGGGSHVPTIGGRVPTKSQDPFEGYYPSDMDTGGETEYYGFVDAEGAWYIQQMTSTASRYVSGSDGYEAAWTGRAGLEYDYFYNL